MVTSDMLTRLKNMFGELWDELRDEGDEPLLLVDPAFVYVTQNANHQLFSVVVKAGVAAGRREHVALVEQGQLLCALPAASDVGPPTAFLLSGAAGSEVIRIPSKVFIEALVDPARQAEVEPLFDG